MNLPITVPLTRPIMVGGETRSALQFDEPDLATQVAFIELEETFSDPPTKAEAARVNLFWVARLAGISEEDAGRIKSADQSAVYDAVEAILASEEDTAGNGAAAA